MQKFTPCQKPHVVTFSLQPYSKSLMITIPNICWGCFYCNSTPQQYCKTSFCIESQSNNNSHFSLTSVWAPTEQSWFHLPLLVLLKIQLWNWHSQPLNWWENWSNCKLILGGNGRKLAKSVFCSTGCMYQYKGSNRNTNQGEIVPPFFFTTLNRYNNSKLH